MRLRRLSLTPVRFFYTRKILIRLVKQTVFASLVLVRISLAYKVSWQQSSNKRDVYCFADGHCSLHFTTDFII